MAERIVGSPVQFTSRGLDNIDVAEDSKYLYFRVDKTVAGVQSASGKSNVLASTRGNVDLGGIKVGINCYRSIR